jgi:hypothetical protein
MKRRVAVVSIRSLSVLLAVSMWFRSHSWFGKRDLDGVGEVAGQRIRVA